jgi:thiamine-phosphate diphosphorylase
LMETGIEGIAVSGAIINAEDPVEETRRFIREINKHKPDPCRDDSEI